MTQGQTGPVPRVLVIAGSDSGGGAGIQADIKTITMLGGYAATAVTAVTVQNTLGVTGVHGVPPLVVAAQIGAVLSDIGADAIKIGMLNDAETVAAVADAIEGFRGPVVLDPVMVAKGGSSLLGDTAVSALLARLLPVATVVTPNVPELAVLTGCTIANETDMLLAAQKLLSSGKAGLAPGAVLAKGGHLQGHEVTDWLVEPAAQTRFGGPRIDTSSSHGTGCTLASALATGLAAGLALPEAVALARNFVVQALRAAPGFGHGHGPMGHQAVRLLLPVPPSPA